jgi:TRAP-type C4-dicarboxylate transport system permease small subunit
MNTLESTSERLARIVRLAAGVLLVIVTVSMLTVILGRYVGFATAWADEVARIAFVWCASLGAVSGIQRRLHFVVFQASTVKSERTRRILESLSISIMLALCLILAWTTTKSIPIAALSILPAIGFSNAWFHWAVSTFALLSAFFLITRLFVIWQKD